MENKEYKVAYVKEYASAEKTVEEIEKRINELDKEGYAFIHAEHDLGWVHKHILYFKRKPVVE